MSNYQELYEKWLNSSALTEEEKLQLKNVADDEVEKEDRFYKELEFGTAGLRGKVGMGSNRMNRFIIARATELKHTYSKICVQLQNYHLQFVT